MITLSINPARGSGRHYRPAGIEPSMWLSLAHIFESVRAGGLGAHHDPDDDATWYGTITPEMHAAYEAGVRG